MRSRPPPVRKRERQTRQQVARSSASQDGNEQRVAPLRGDAIERDGSGAAVRASAPAVPGSGSSQARRERRYRSTQGRERVPSGAPGLAPPSAEAPPWPTPAPDEAWAEAAPLVDAEPVYDDAAVGVEPDSRGPEAATEAEGTMLRGPPALETTGGVFEGEVVSGSEVADTAEAMGPALPPGWEEETPGAEGGGVAKSEAADALRVALDRMRDARAGPDGVQETEEERRARENVAARGEALLAIMVSGRAGRVSDARGCGTEGGQGYDPSSVAECRGVRAGGGVQAGPFVGRALLRPPRPPHPCCREVPGFRATVPGGAPAAAVRRCCL